MLVSSSETKISFKEKKILFSSVENKRNGKLRYFSITPYFGKVSKVNFPEST